MKRVLFIFILICLVIFNIVLQIILFRDGLDNKIINSHDLSRGDAIGYVNKAKIIADENDFIKAFGDGFRLPGYPLFLTIFFKLFDKPLLITRYAQIILSSFLIVFAYFIINSATKNKIFGLIASGAVCIWLPFHYFSCILIAETCSFFCLGLLCLILEKTDKLNRVGIILISIILVALIYLKPNHIFLIIPVLIFLGIKFNKKVRNQYIITLISLMMLFILPWTIFISLSNKSFIFLSTVQGYNLYCGTGGFMYSIGNDLPTYVYKALKFNHKLDTTFNFHPYLAEGNKKFHNLAIKRWLKYPIKTTIFGFAKILHSFGFSFRYKRDFIITAQFLFAIFAFLNLYKAKRYLRWVYFFCGSLFISSLQSFIFLKSQRFKIMFFDFPAILIIILFLYYIYEQKYNLSTK